MIPSHPGDPAAIGALAAATLLANYAVVSFLEYGIHRHLMHRRRLPRAVYRALPYLREVFEAHAARHHGRWYARFDHEPDPVGREENLAILPIDTLAIVLAATPLWGIQLLVWPPAGVVCVAMICLHNQVWNAIHRQMHVPGGAFFRGWAAYRFLARYHLLHHRRPGRNFNLVAPLADRLMGRRARPRLRDVRTMLELGLLRPRSARARARFEARRGPGYARSLPVSA